MSQKLRHILLASLLAAAATTAVDASEFSEDLAARRARMMERLGPETLLVLWSAPPRVYSLDVNYEYRQDSNLYYLTGLTQEDTILVLMPGNRTKRELLFVRDRDPVREHWNGLSLSREQAASQTGISTVYSVREFDAFVAGVLSGTGYERMDTQETSAFSRALAEGAARIALDLGPRALNTPLEGPLAFSRTIRDRFVGFTIADATPMLTDLRLVKTPYERRLLIESLKISNDAQMAGMRVARPDAWEYEVEAAIEAVHHARGAVSWAYPSIVGSGPNATVLHYTEGARQMKAGELLLVDAAANYQYMSGDITRTYPVSGTFSPVQRDIYAVVLEAQEEGMKVARPGASLKAIHDKTVEVIKAGLLRLGLIADTKGEQYRMWFTHGACHYIGIDVHDVGERARELKPGMAFVIEPGIYIRQSALDALPRTAENALLIEKIQPAVTKYRDIGVRIEDAFLLDDSGLQRLTASVPRSIDEVEQFMRGRSGAAASSSAR